jgi:hypothetical protein
VVSCRRQDYHRGDGLSVHKDTSIVAIGIGREHVKNWRVLLSGVCCRASAYGIRCSARASIGAIAATKRHPRPPLPWPPLSAALLPPASESQSTTLVSNEEASQRGTVLKQSLLHNRVGVGNPAVDPAQPISTLPRRGAEVRCGPVNGDTATVGRMVGRREGRGWPEEGSPPLTGRRGREIDFVERVPALDAGDYDTRKTGLPFEQHLTGPWAARTAAAGGGSQVSRPARDRLLQGTAALQRHTRQLIATSAATHGHRASSDHPGAFNLQRPHRGQSVAADGPDAPAGRAAPIVTYAADRLKPFNNGTQASDLLGVPTTPVPTLSVNLTARPGLEAAPS